MFKINKIYCKCGCGKEIPFNKFHRYYTPNYMHGHRSGQTKEKFKKTCLKKYGVEYPSQSEIVKEKMKLTSMKRYGTKIPFQSEEVKQKFKKTCLKKYGVEHPLQNENVKNKLKCTLFEKYGVVNISQVRKIKDISSMKRLYNSYQNLFSSNRLNGLVKPLFSLEDYKGIKNKYKYKFQCLKCTNIFEDHLEDGKIPRCYTCYPVLKNFNSKYEDEISIWLNDSGIKNIQRGNQSIINPYQLDIYLPDYNLAIEFNGLYWHSELGGNKDKNYHLNKTNLCKEKGIELIHIFEDEWIEKQDIVKSIIKNKLGLIENRLYARECIIKEVDKEEALLFLMNNHLQEAIICKYFIGLYYKDELVYLISLSKPRFNKNYGCELIRSCGKIDTTIIGGFNKLINYVKKELNITSLISYVDKRYFNGKGYKDWNLLNETKPNYFYTKEYQTRESRIKYQKHKIIEKEDDKVLTEWQIMQLKGYDRVWDCGNKVFENRNPLLLNRDSHVR